MRDRKILLVDDDEDYTSSIVDLLEGEGIAEIMVAKNGREALMLLRELSQPPCLMLLDLQMPEMSGQELIAALEGDFKTIPIVVCSAKHKVTSPQVIAQLPKPVDIEKLLRLCSRMAGRDEA